MDTGATLSPPTTVRSGADQGASLLVAIPALNEASTVDAVVRAVPSRIPGIREIEILVIDDGSTDDTSEKAQTAGAMVIRHSAPGGVGSAFHSAHAYAIRHGFDLLVTIDADGQMDPSHIPDLVAPVVSEEADFTTASRFKEPALTPQMPTMRRWGNRMISRVISHLTGQRFFDVSCGLRCYSRSALLHLHLLGSFTYTQEVFLNLASKRLRILEVPVAVLGTRKHGRSRVARSLWRYAWQSSKIILRSYRDYHPLRFFGASAAVLLSAAAALALFLGQHYLATGSLSPHKWAGFAAGFLVFLALLLLVAGMIGDQLNRQRIYLEELLYRVRSGGAQPAGGEGSLDRRAR
jgi:glycosyltransferase involved in cell wall biosynthesis